MVVFIIAAVFLAIYLIGGAVIGIAAHVNQAWPIYNEGQDFIDGDKSAPFFFACGPLFWIVLGFKLLFTAIWNMVDWEA